MDASFPPRYRRHSSRHGPAPLSGSELPSYTRHSTEGAHPRQATEHLFHILNGKGKPWITLKVYSSAKSAKSLPTFFEKEKITGLLELDAEKGDSIQAITATVTGRIITGSNIDDSFAFLNHTQPIWAKSPDSPRLPSPSVGTLSNKLTGHCVWPLSIPISRTVDAPTGAGNTRSFRLPETFLERHTKVSIQYDLTINVSRGKLRADNNIKTAFGYVPSTRPDPPSLLKQLAYQQFLPLPGPLSDPEGWKTLRPVAVRGVVLKSHEAEVRCTLSLSKPLCYARGAVIPCFITLEGCEPQLLDLLLAPHSIVLSLRRRVRFYNQTSSSRQDVAWNETVEDMGSAVWWPSSDNRSCSTTRCLEGEIRLTKDLRPTSEMGHFSISYTVVLCPFDALGFTSDATTLLSEPVQIATMNAKGPRPNAYAPPAYDRDPLTPRNKDDTYVSTYNVGTFLS